MADPLSRQKMGHGEDHVMEFLPHYQRLTSLRERFISLMIIGFAY